MSLRTAFDAVVKSLEHEDLLRALGLDVSDKVNIGIPDDPFNRAPALYAEPGVEARERSGLRRTITTSTVAEVVVIYVFQKRDLPGGMELLDWMLARSQDIIDRIEEDNDSGVYLRDGDCGFAGYVVQTRFYFRPEDPIAGIRVSIRVESYH